MQTSRLTSALRLAVSALVLLAPALPAAAQKIDFSKPRSHFPNFVAPYMGREVAPPTLNNTSRMGQLLKDGTLRLSLNDAIALALENNLDLAIARYNLDIADTDVLRAKAGGATRGVNTGLVQGTPGGGNLGLGTGATGTQGGGAGGTTLGAGGAGTGAAGLVTSTSGVGSAVSSYDPILTGDYQSDHARNQCTSFFCGTVQNTTTANFSYRQGFISGTNLSVGFNNTRTASNNPVLQISPTLNTNFRFALSQHLLQGFGFLPNRRFITIARNNREISDVAFRQQVITTVSQIQNIYWDLVNAYEDVKVKERSITFAEKTLSDNKKQVEIGTLAPIEIVRAESEVATRKQELIVSQTTLQLQQLLMKNALSRSLTDPALADAGVVPTDTMSMPASEPVTPVQDLVGDALSHRAELAQARIDLKNREITNKSARNALLPSLDAFAYYGGTGLGGSQNPANVCNPNIPPADQPFCNPAGSVKSVSYGGSFGQMFDSTAPDKGVGLQLTIPLRNRAAQADQVRSELEYRQAEMRLLQLENQVRIEVRNAQFALQQSRARVEAARAGVELARQSLDAEQKKYSLGASTNTQVLQTQRDMTQAESNLVAANAAYEKQRVELDRVTGLTLLHNGIDIADAERGQVTKMPVVPGVAPRQESPAQQ